MAGGKRNKLKKSLPAMSGPPSNAELEDNELVDDLLAQLDARDATVQQQSAKVLSEIKKDQDQSQQDDRSRNSSKNRYKAREVSFHVVHQLERFHPAKPRYVKLQLASYN